MKLVLVFLLFFSSCAMSQDRTKEAIQLSKMFNQLYLDNNIDSALLLASSYMGGHDSRSDGWSKVHQKEMLNEEVMDIAGVYQLKMIKSFYYPKYWSKTDRFLEAYVIYWKVNDDYFILNNIIDNGEKLFVDFIRIDTIIMNGTSNKGVNRLKKLLVNEEYKFSEIEKYIKKNG